jgi:hypothetical protein
MDPREEILARLLEIAGGVDATLNARRNETVLADSALPVVVLLDGEELAADDDPEGRPASAPRRVTMTPEVQFRLASSAAEVGTRLNELRAKLIKAVLSDAALLALTENGRSARYLGSNMVAERGRSMEGGIGVAFAFRYLMRPGSLVEEVTA